MAVINGVSLYLMGKTEGCRRFPRLNVGPEHALHFRVGPKAFVQAPLVDMSASGCCARVPSQEAQTLEKGALISHVSIQSRDLPNIRMQGRVVWVLGKHAVKTDGYALMGVEFVGVREEITTLLNDYVLKNLLVPVE